MVGRILDPKIYLMNCTVSVSSGSISSASMVIVLLTDGNFTSEQWFFQVKMLTDDFVDLGFDGSPVNVFMFGNRQIIRAVEDPSDTFDGKELLCQW